MLNINKKFIFVLFFLLINNSWGLQITGNHRIERETIIQHIGDNKDINAIKKRLENLDFFSKIVVKKETNDIFIEVEEYPFISEIKFVGNSKLSDEILTSEISLKKKTLFSPQKLKQDINNIQQLYLKTGSFLAFIEPKMVPQAQHRAEIIFEIKEGKKAKIEQIYFIGNKVFSNKTLLDEISTKKTLWWKFLASADVYDPDRIEYDKDLLRKFYNNNGYADFAIIETSSQINSQKTAFFISFLLEEGLQYKFGSIDIVNQINNFDSDILKDRIKFKENQIYNAEAIENTVNSMIEIMSQHSYAFANIEPVLKKDRQQQKINVEFILNETPRIYIDQINISGNTRTIDEVIRRELRIQEGDPYNINKINRSKQRIENLGFFEKVDFQTQRIGDGDKVILQITVKEKKTGELNFGLGYSTVDRFNINAGIKENNLFGTGRQIGINVQKSFATINAELNYTKPYFFDHPVDVGFDVFKYNLSKRNSIVYDQDNSGFKLNANYSISEFLTHQLSYNYNSQKIGNIDSGASFIIQNMQGHFVYSGLEQSFLYDKRNNRLDPRSGYFASFLQHYNGIGGNVKSIKHELSSGYYQPTFSNEFVLKLLVKAGIIDGIGQSVLSNNNFFLGGNNFRGFEYAGLGPRTSVDGRSKNGEALGGKRYWIGTAEFRFPLGLPKELGIYGALFSDNGVLKDSDMSGAVINDSSQLRSSYGLSIAWASPMGPIRLDFAKVLRKANYDRTQNFRFSIGTSF